MHQVTEPTHHPSNVQFNQHWSCLPNGQRRGRPPSLAAEIKPTTMAHHHFTKNHEFMWSESLPPTKSPAAESRTHQRKPSQTTQVITTKNCGPIGTRLPAPLGVPVGVPRQVQDRAEGADGALHRGEGQPQRAGDATPGEQRRKGAREDGALRAAGGEAAGAAGGRPLQGRDGARQGEFLPANQPAPPPLGQSNSRSNQNNGRRRLST